MQAQNFMRVEEVAQELGISKSHAYKVIHVYNDPLAYAELILNGEPELYLKAVTEKHLLG